MKMEFDPTGSLKGIKIILDQFDKDSEIKGLMMMVGCEAQIKIPELNTLLKKVSKPLFGGIFPKIFTNDYLGEKGAVIIGFKKNIDIICIPQLNNPEVDFIDQIQKASFNLKPIKTMMVFTDGRSSENERFINALFQLFGLEFNYIGGGAGCSHGHKPCIITNQGIQKNAAVFALSPVSSTVEVEHGWEKAAGPYRVTDVENNRVIKEIEGQPAFPFYQNLLKEKFQKIITPDNFLEVAMCYPFGISKFESESIARVALSTDGSSMTCAGDVQLHSLVDILTGDPQTLLKAVEKAVHNALISSVKGARRHCFFISCFSRALYLKEHYQKEIDVIKNMQLPSFGALTIGEIANNGQEYLEFYNKTNVVSILNST